MHPDSNTATSSSTCAIYPGYDHYPINDPSLESVFRIAEKYQVPVMIHTGDTYSNSAKVRMAHPLLVDDMAVDNPDVQFVDVSPRQPLVPRSSTRTTTSTTTSLGSRSVSSRTRSSATWRCGSVT